MESNIWWHEPKWLTSDEQEKANMKSTKMTMNYPPEVQCHKCTGMTESKPIMDVENYSSYGRLLQVTAWVFRFVNNANKEYRKGPLTGKEVTIAETYWIRQTQGLIWRQRGSRATSAKTFEISGQEVYLDDEGLIRLTGRLQYSQVSSQNVIVLLKDAIFTELLIRHVHQLVLHGGVQATLAQLRTKFWILQGRQAVKRVLIKCMVCKKHNTRPASQPMPPLPVDRVNESLPFQVTGLDFAGTLYAKYKDEIISQYVVVFTCVVTRGVHLEVTNDMSTSSFLQAFRRFTAQRGIPAIIYSDNARTFKRAKKEINRMLETIRKQQVKDYCSVRSIQWETIAECAPWWGGFYECLI